MRDPIANILVYAHRAGRGLAPENTLYACQKSLQYPIHYIDLDLGMTKDGMLVATHDLTLNPNITRDTYGHFISDSIPIYELTYQQLSTYNVGQINPKSHYFSYFPFQERVEFEKIPLLKDVISYVHSLRPDVKFQLEIKTDPSRPSLTASPQMFAESVSKILGEWQIMESTEVQAFNYHVLLAIQKINPAIKTAYLTSLQEKETSFDLWSAGYDPKHFGNSIPKMIKALGGSCWGPFQMELEQKDVEEAQHLGLKVVPWGYAEKEETEFNAVQIAKLIDWQVDGIITDRPDSLCKMLCRFPH